MTWFKVDDKLHGHRKARRLRRSHDAKKRDAAPFGIWVLAGSWCGDNATGGFVPLEVLEDWDDDAEALAERLVAAGLWHCGEMDGEPGYHFNDWSESNPSSSGAYGNHVRWHVNEGRVDPECDHCPKEPEEDPDSSGGYRPDVAPDIGAMSDPNRGGESQTVVLPDPTRPDPNPSRPEPVARKRAAKMPKNWKPTTEHLERALAADLDLGKQADKFRAHAEEKGRTAVNWNAAFTRWLMNAAEYAERDRPTQSRSSASLMPVHLLEDPPPGLNVEEYDAWHREQVAKRKAYSA